MNVERSELEPDLEKWRDQIREAAKLISVADKTVALTGAGISVDSGIPEFRGAQGLWERYDPMEYAHIDAFLRNPHKVWEMLQEMREIIEAAEPNPAHRALAELEKMGHLAAVITQNVDNLHRRAGSCEVIEFHGNGERLVCLTCGRTYEREEIDWASFPPRCACSNILKPDVVLFGEMIPLEASRRADKATQDCSVMMVIGTSAEIYPASELPRTAKSTGAHIVEINLEPTGLTERVTDVYIGESASLVLPALVEEVKLANEQDE